MIEIKPEKIIETISNLKTGKVYKDDEEWKACDRDWETVPSNTSAEAA